MKQRAVIKAIDNDEYIAMLPQFPKRKSECEKQKRQLATTPGCIKHESAVTQSVTPMDIVSFSQCRETASMPRQQRSQYKQDLRDGVYGCSARNNATAIPVNTTGLAHKELGNPPRGYGLHVDKALLRVCNCATVHP